MSDVIENTTNEPTVRELSKRVRAGIIFTEKLNERAQGLFGSNKEFRAVVLSAITAELGVSVASAATMYNSAKAEAEKSDTELNLGRDPKKVKVIGSGRRGRPAGSTNKKKEESPQSNELETVAA